MNEKESLKVIEEAFIYGYPIVGMYDLLNSQVLDSKTSVTSLNEF